MRRNAYPVRRLAALALGVLAAGLLTVVAKPAAAVAAPAPPSTVDRVPAAAFRNPVKENGADPYMFVHDGYYHLTYTRNDRITVSRARSVTELATAPETTIWLVSGTVADQQHEGHPGWRIDQIAANVDGYLAASRPGIVLLHIGTNDMNQNHDVADAPQRLVALIDRILAAAPGVTVVVASIIPSTDATVDSRIRAFNAAVPELVRSRAEAGRKVRHVDMYSVLTPADFADALHPNDAGYAKMAAAWHAAISDLYE